MSHFAHITGGVVDNVIVIDAETLASGRWGDPASWVQTSYNTHGGVHPEGRPLRKNFAGIGFFYDPIKDAFVAPTPYLSWILDSETCLWCPPTPMPDGGSYSWNEQSLSWVENILYERVRP